MHREVLAGIRYHESPENSPILLLLGVLLKGLKRKIDISLFIRG